MESKPEQQLLYHPMRLAEVISETERRNAIPLSLEIELCQHSNIEPAHKKRTRVFEEAKPETVKRVLADAALLGIHSVVFAGRGEPLLHPDFIQIVESSPDSLRLGIVTNGLKLLKGAILRFVQKMAFLELRLDASSARTYARVQNVERDDFRAVLANLESVLNLRAISPGSNLKVIASFQIMPENAEEIFSFAKRMSNLGVDEVHFECVDLSELGRFRKELERLRRPEFAIVVNVTKQGSSILSKYCQKFGVFLCADGNACPCRPLADIGYFFGNANEEKLEDMLLGEKREEIFRNSSKKQLTACASCLGNRINSFVNSLVVDCRAREGFVIPTWKR